MNMENYAQARAVVEQALIDAPAKGVTKVYDVAVTVMLALERNGFNIVRSAKREVRS